MIGEPFIDVDPETQWCDAHWTVVADSIMEGSAPINGLMATIEIFNEWFRVKFEEMGITFPTVSQPERITALFEEDSPLCCYLGDERLTLIYSTCIVPEHLRKLDVRTGHLIHVQEARGVIVAEVERGKAHLDIPLIEPGSLN